MWCFFLDFINIINVLQTRKIRTMDLWCTTDRELFGRRRWRTRYISKFFRQIWTALSVTRCKNKKVATMFPKDAKTVTTAVLLWSGVFQNSPKSPQIFGLILWKKLLPRTLKNRPIRPHWLHSNGVIWFFIASYQRAPCLSLPFWSSSVEID